MFSVVVVCLFVCFDNVNNQENIFFNLFFLRKHLVWTMIMGSWDVTTRRYYKGHSVPSFPICQIKTIAREIIKYRSLTSTPKY